VIVSDKPRSNAFVVKLRNESGGFVERHLATASHDQRDEWIEAIERVATQLDGSFVIEKAVPEAHKKIVIKIGSR
jgi:hypothetical protein